MYIHSKAEKNDSAFDYTIVKDYINKKALDFTIIKGNIIYYLEMSKCPPEIPPPPPAPPPPLPPTPPCCWYWKTCVAESRQKS